MNKAGVVSVVLMASGVFGCGATAGAAQAPVDGTAATPVTGIPAVQLNYRGQLLALITRGRGTAVLTIEDIDGSHAHPVVIPGGCAPAAVRWARRWSDLAILTRCATDAAHPQPTGALWVMDVQRGTPPRELVAFDGTASEVQWRGDGKAVAFRFTPFAPAGSDGPEPSVIMAGPVDGGKFGVASPAGLDVDEFYLSPLGSGVLLTASPDGSPAALPALYEIADAKVVEVFDPATAQGALHGIRIGRLRLSPAFGDRPMPLFFLARQAASAQSGADLYIKLPNRSAPIVNLTAAQAAKPGWFEPSGISAVATHVAGGSTDMISYIAQPSGAGLRRARVLCTIPGVITDGGGAGSQSTNGGRYAYFEYPKAGGPMTLNVGAWRLGMACKPRWSRPVAASAVTGAASV